LADQLAQIKKGFKYPFKLENNDDGAFIETGVFDPNSGNYFKYVALVCSMFECIQALEEKFGSRIDGF
jgi:hypothetical protein